MPSRQSPARRTSAWSHTLSQRQHDRSQFRAPPMPAHRYVEENGSAARRSASVASEVNLRENVTNIPSPSMNKAPHMGFETRVRHHQKSETGVSVTPLKGMSFKSFFCPTIKYTEEIYLFCFFKTTSLYLEPTLSLMS